MTIYETLLVIADEIDVREEYNRYKDYVEEQNEALESTITGD